MQRKTNRSTMESLQKYEPFFAMIQKDAAHSKGITMVQHPNPISGVADIVMVTFSWMLWAVREIKVYAKSVFGHGDLA